MMPKQENQSIKKAAAYPESLPARRTPTMPPSKDLNSFA